VPRSPHAAYGSRAALFFLTLFAAAPAAAVHAEEVKAKSTTAVAAVLQKAAPESIADLKAIQEQVKVVVKKVVPCTVNVKVGFAQGSGVIVKGGYVLTAGHVSGRTGRDVVITLADNRQIKGKTLGGNRGIDSGLIKITDKGDWPSVEMGKSADLKAGQWCVAVGHPGGLQPKRTPVVRLGRLQRAEKDALVSDCTLVGGDSGGPLFDLEGRVIGIHSRIGMFIGFNVHVPIDTFRETWDRLADSQIWGGPEYGNGGNLGARAVTKEDECRIILVEGESAAAKAGLKVDDVVVKLNGHTLKTAGRFRDELRKKRPGDEVTLVIRRGKETQTFKIHLGKYRG
jgi:serine protease Do